MLLDWDPVYRMIDHLTDRVVRILEISDLPRFTTRALLNAQTDIPRLVRELHERTGLTQEKFAVKLSVTFPTINRWENSRARPSPLAMEKIEALLRGMGDRGSDLLAEIFGDEPLQQG